LVKRRKPPDPSPEIAQLAEQIVEAMYNGDCDQIRRLHAESHDQFQEALTTDRFQRDFVWYITKISEETIVTLVELGVNLNRHNNEGYAPGGTYPLEACIFLEEDLQRAEFLLKMGADPNVCDGLNSVCSMDKKPHLRIPMAKLLIEYGADVNRDLPNIPGYTPWLRALDVDDQALAEFFVSQGAIQVELPEREIIPLDLATFQTRLEEACTKCWQDVQAKFPEETFCLFGLEADSDFVVIRPLFDSEAAIERDAEERRPSQHYVARVSLDCDAEFYGQGREHLSRLSTELNSQYGQRESFFGRWLRIRRLRTIFEAALKRLDQQGLFGTGSERERIILLVSIIDADRREWNQMLKIAKRLNPPKVFEAFKKTLAM